MGGCRFSPTRTCDGYGAVAPPAGQPISGSSLNPAACSSFRRRAPQRAHLSHTLLHRHPCRSQYFPQLVRSLIFLQCRKLNGVHLVARAGRRTVTRPQVGLAGWFCSKFCDHSVGSVNSINVFDSVPLITHNTTESSHRPRCYPNFVNESRVTYDEDRHAGIQPTQP